MQHPDEGTIHAWLDGALDEGDAARVAAHVATCPECESRVVEARGLIAGASRVLSALDAVPAGVIPPSRDAAPDETTPERPGDRTRHWWRRRGVLPSLAAAAAVAFVAVGSSVVLRERGPSAKYEMAEVARTASAPARDTTIATPEVAMAPAPAVASASAPGSKAPAVAPTVAPTVVPPHRETETRDRVQPNAAAQQRRAASSPALGGVVAGAAPRGYAAPAPTQPAVPPAMTPSTAVTEAPSRALDAGAAERKAVAKGTVDSAARADRLRSAPTQLENVVVTSVGASRADANAPERALRGAAQRSAPAAAPPTAPRPETAGALAGCYEIVEGDTTFLPRRFVLDTTATTVTSGERADTPRLARIAASYVIRNASDRSTAGSWSVLGPVARLTFPQPSGASAVLELRAGLAARFAAKLVVGDSSWTLQLRRCEQ